MAINYSAERLPMGDGEWAALLGAIEASLPSDETDWLEHKAGVDPSTKAGGATLAKGIVAFANRAPDQAARWLGGYGLIVIGLEPGQVQGTPSIDPAALHDQVNRYLAPPAPTWDSSQHVYKGQNVLVVTVAPPRYGDPIAVLSKDGTDVINGHIYVRRAGKSEPARHEDLRRLEARLLSGERASVEIHVEAADESPVARIAYESGWVDEWIARERARLLAPLTPPPKKDRFATLGLAGLDPKLFAPRQGVLDALGAVEHDEDRTEEEFRTEVEDYLDRAAVRLPQVLGSLRSHYASEHAFVVRNRSTRNYKDLEVRIHIEGEVSGTDYREDIAELSEVAGKPPREWGPWIERPRNPLFDRHYSLPVAMPNFPSQGFSPSPQIENGGSVAITFPPFDLRPGESWGLDAILLYADERMTGSTRVTWSATATNVDAVAEGEATLTISDAPIDVTSHLR